MLMLYVLISWTDWLTDCWIVGLLCRRRKVGSVLLKACDAVSKQWGFKHLVLRAYEDDMAARKLYDDSGYQVVSTDPNWMAWIGRRRRVLMIKSLPSL